MKPGSVMPLLLANQQTSGAGGIQRYMARLARELSETHGGTILLEPQGGTHDIARVSYRAYRSGSRAVEFASAFATYVRTRLQLRPKYILASIWFPSGLLLALLPKSMRRPLGILAHGTEIGPSKKGLRRALMRYTFAQADVVFANSRYVRDLLAQTGVTDNVTIVHCGVDPLDDRPERSRTPTILAVGRLIRRKGFDTLIETLPTVIKKFPDVRLVIVGEGPLRETLIARVTELGIADHVDFRGRVTDDELADVYRRSWCFALPTRRIGDDVEGFGIVYLEASNLGLPVIGGKNCGAEDAIEDGVTGLLVDGDDVGDVAQAVIALLADPRRASSMGENGRRRAQTDFSWADVARKVDIAMLGGSA